MAQLVAHLVSILLFLIHTASLVCLRVLFSHPHTVPVYYMFLAAHMMADLLVMLAAIVLSPLLNAAVNYYSLVLTWWCLFLQLGIIVIDIWLWDHRVNEFSEITSLSWFVVVHIINVACNCLCFYVRTLCPCAAFRFECFTVTLRL